MSEIYICMQSYSLEVVDRPSKTQLQVSKIKIKGSQGAKTFLFLNDSFLCYVLKTTSSGDHISLGGMAYFFNSCK